MPGTRKRRPAILYPGASPTILSRLRADLTCSARASCSSESCLRCLDPIEHELNGVDHELRLLVLGVVAAVCRLDVKAVS